jgi:hypothetical protein
MAMVKRAGEDVVDESLASGSSGRCLNHRVDLHASRARECVATGNGPIARVQQMRLDSGVSE